MSDIVDNNSQELDEYTQKGKACYENGEYAEAVKWWRKSAEQGNAAGQNCLGFCYEKGQGVEQCYAEAVKWYLKAAEQNYAPSQHNLGVCYQNGQGVEQNYTEAVKWYQKAAEQGNAKAIEALKRLQ